MFSVYRKCYRKTCFFYPECRGYFTLGKTEKELKKNLKKRCSDYNRMTCTKEEQEASIKIYDRIWTKNKKKVNDDQGR